MSWYQEPPPDWGGVRKPPELNFEPQLDAPYPVKAGAADGLPVVYRTDVLVAPAGLVATPALVAELDALLAPRGWTIEPLPPHGGETLWELHGPRPDAAAALADLRASAAGASPEAAAAIAVFALRRQYFVGTPKGMPAKDGHAGAEREARVVLAEPRYRHPAAPGGRRPVVAIVDTGIGAHPWLADFWVDARPDWPALPADAVPAEEGTGNVTPPDGKLDTHAGHGTFIAGLIRQLAPDARVLSLRAMRGDGALDERLVLNALEWLRNRVKAAAADDDGARFVDIVCLAFGYYRRNAADDEHTRELAEILGELGEYGVQVVASAGNQSSDEPCFPAALAACQPRPAVPLASVGAVNPDGSQADYSNYGDWVTHTEVGTAVISTMPAFVPATVNLSPGPHEYNPDNMVRGFATWGGTSFAAAVFAGRLAAALSERAGSPDALVHVTPEAARARAAAAIAAVGHA
jgi:hypothetical protein